MKRYASGNFDNVQNELNQMQDYDQLYLQGEIVGDFTLEVPQRRSLTIRGEVGSKMIQQAEGVPVFSAHGNYRPYFYNIDGFSLLADSVERCNINYCKLVGTVQFLGDVCPRASITYCVADGLSQAFSFNTQMDGLRLGHCDFENITDEAISCLDGNYVFLWSNKFSNCPQAIVGGNMENLYIQRNALQGSDGVQGIQLGSIQKATVYRNLVFGYEEGIQIYGSASVNAYYNTLVNCKTGIHSLSSTGVMAPNTYNGCEQELVQE